jgi:ribonuclease P protein component
MLRSRIDFDAFATGSRSRANELLVMRYRRNDLDLTRYGISTGRKLGTAVVRNRVRRRLRTVLRVIDGQVERGWDVLLVARPPAAAASQAELAAALTGVLKGARLTGAEHVPA